MPHSPLMAAAAGLVGSACLIATGAADAAPKRSGTATAGDLAACVNKKTGAMRMLRKPTLRCRKTERKVRWATRGPAGAAGPAGAPGAAGAAGASGLMAAFASGTPTINVASEWTTLMSTSFTGAPGMLYWWGSDFPEGRLGTCPEGGNFVVYSRILANGSIDPLGSYWRGQTGTITLQLQAKADSAMGTDGAPCTTAADFALGYATLYVQAARRP